MTSLFIIYILFLHWVFDFRLQSNEMAINKSKSFFYLFYHCFVYSCWGVLMYPFIGQDQALVFMGYLFITHLFIDGITSRVTSYFWKRDEKHNFFTTIGLDQLLHYATIFSALEYMMKG